MKMSLAESLCLNPQKCQSLLKIGLYLKGSMVDSLVKPARYFSFYQM